jgi:hypothetical protein
MYESFFKNKIKYPENLVYTEVFQGKYKINLFH